MSRTLARVNLNDALRELDVGPDADADVVRRAYLRLLKTRKPEVDPAGFQRLREAYETAKATHEWRQRLRPVDDNDRNAPVPIVLPTPTVTPVAPSLPPAVAEAIPSQADTTTDAPSEVVASFAPPPPPEATPAPVVDRLPTLDEIAACVRDGKPRAAGKRMRALFDAAASSIDVDVPPISAAFQTILRLHEDGDLASADRLYHAVTRWLDATGAEARLVRDRLATEWVVIRELAALPDSLSQQVRAPIAAAAREGDLFRAYDALATFRVFDPKAVKEAGYLIRTRAPVIHSALGAAFEAPRVPTKSKSEAPWFLRWGAISLVIGLIRIFTSATNDCNHTVGHSGHSTYAPSRAAPAPFDPLGVAGDTPAERAPDAGRIDLTPDMLVSKGSAKVLAEAAAAEKKPRIAVNAASVHDALAVGNCSSARASMDMLRDAVRDEKPSPKLRARVAVLETNFSRGCESAPTTTPVTTEADARDAGEPRGGSL